MRNIFLYIERIWKLSVFILEVLLFWDIYISVVFIEFNEVKNIFKDGIDKCYIEFIVI